MTNEMLIYNEQINQEANIELNDGYKDGRRKIFFQDNQRNFGEKQMNSKNRE